MTKALAGALVVAGLLAAAACGNEKQAIESPTVLIDTGERSVRVRVEIADSPSERERGLMNRKSLPEDAGMLFVYESDTTGGFWMKDTLIPLSIAFYDANGKIVRILDMEPCRSEPCPVYDPGVAYRGALEVNRGAFERWGVREGDVITLAGG